MDLICYIAFASVNSSLSASKVHEEPSSIVNSPSIHVSHLHYHKESNMAFCPTPCQEMSMSPISRSTDLNLTAKDLREPFKLTSWINLIQEKITYLLRAKHPPPFAMQQ